LGTEPREEWYMLGDSQTSITMFLKVGKNEKEQIQMEEVCSLDI
jgi:hypothetical protein